MLTLTFKELNDPLFNRTLNRLSRESGYTNFKASYNIAKILRRLTAELGTARDLNKKVLKEFTKLDEKKEPTFDVKTQMPLFLDEKSQEAYYEKHKEFLKTEFEIDCSPIFVDDLGTVKMSPEEINALGEILVLDKPVAPALVSK